MFITQSFKKSLIVEQFQGNYLKQLERRSLKKIRAFHPIPQYKYELFHIYFTLFHLYVKDWLVTSSEVW